MVRDPLTPEDRRIWNRVVSTLEFFMQPVMPTTSSCKSASPATINRKTIRNVEIQGSLDLHGMTQDQAYQTLLSFIPNARERGKKSILIITGKGSGVLKTQVPKWLAATPLSHHVRGTAKASLKDGGEGALYVFLKR